MAFDFDSVRSMFEGVVYFHGRLSPQQANFRLHRRGCFHGLYLIYEEIEVPGKYTLAICSDDKIRNYYLGISADGRITYGDGVTAPLMHPHELIHYHLQKCTSFPVRPLVPCIRPKENDRKPMAWQTVTMEELETRMLHVAENKTTTTNSAEVLRSRRKEYINSVAKSLHVHQPWYHGQIGREEAERRLLNSGKLLGGKFLIRERDDGTLALSLCYKDEFRHYNINRLQTDDGELFLLNDEPAHHSLMDIVEHYSTKPQSFVLALKIPCVRDGYEKPEIPKLQSEFVEVLRAYVNEIDHIQNPKDQPQDSATGNNIKTTENLLSVENIDRPQIQIKAPVDTQKNRAAPVKDEDDAMLEAFISSVIPLNDDLIVTKVIET